MAVRYTRLILLATAAVSLSGCSSLFHSAFFRSERSTSTAAAVELTPYTNAGRAYLAKGETGHAIEAFQRALGLGEPVAPALNGLGVCFARLGRPETAQRLFQQALAIAPDNPQYAANLARLERSQAMAMRDNSAATLMPPAEATLPKTPVAGQLVQVSANEYHLTTVDPAPAPLIGHRPAPDTRFALVGMGNKMTAVTPSKAGDGRAAATGKNERRAVIANPYTRREANAQIQSKASGAAL